MMEAHTAYRAMATHQGAKLPLSRTEQTLLGTGGMQRSGPAQDGLATGEGGEAECERTMRDQMTRDQVILDELPQVYFIAARVLERLPANVQLEDLVHAGVLGLLEAYESFDRTRNAQFKTFARFRVKGAILDSLRELDWGSRGLRRKAREIAEVSAALEARLGRRPEKQEVAEQMQMSLVQLEMAVAELDRLKIVGQRSAPSPETGEVQDLIESAPSLDANPFELYAKAEQKRSLTKAIGALNEREQLLLSLYYHEELTMKEVAEVLGIALARVSQIHQAALAKLRIAMELAGPPAVPGRVARPGKLTGVQPGAKSAAAAATTAIGAIGEVKR
jgi:RNA polymerase sigma factor for flagellar operon FliA